MFSFFKRKNKAFLEFSGGDKIFGSLSELFVYAYGLEHFEIHYFTKGFWHLISFDFDREFYKNLSTMSIENLYDSCFYTFVSMYLTRSERDKFIKLLRRG